MKHHNQIEVILFTPHSLRDARHRALVRWLGTTLQSVIARQQGKAKKLFLNTLKYTPPLYLS